MNTNTSNTVIRNTFACIFLILSLIACWGDDDEVKDIRVIFAEPITSEGELEEFPLPNCGGSSELKQTLGNQTSVKHNITIGTKARVEGGGEVSIPKSAKLIIQAEIELAYQQTYETASSRLDSIEVKAAPKTHIIYVIRWEERTYSSVVFYTLNNKIHDVPYTYVLRIPKISDSYPVKCPEAEPIEQLGPTSTPMMVDRSSLIWDYAMGYQGDFEIPRDVHEPVRITGYAHSWPEFPRLRYSMSGNYEAFVFVKLTPGDVTFGHLAGLGVSSDSSNKILFFGKGRSGGGEDVRAFYYPLDDMRESELNYLGDTTDCVNETTALKIVKSSDYVSLYCSKDGNDWVSVREKYKLELGKNTQLFLFADSVDDLQVEAKFYDFSIIQR